ncbi:hypothetical protein ACLOJK_007579 [Asimina triloba]
MIAGHHRLLSPTSHARSPSSNFQQCRSSLSSLVASDARPVCPPPPVTYIQPIVCPSFFLASTSSSLSRPPSMSSICIDESTLYPSSTICLRFAMLHHRLHQSRFACPIVRPRSRRAGPMPPAPLPARSSISSTPGSSALASPGNPSASIQRPAAPASIRPGPLASSISAVHQRSVRAVADCLRSSSVRAAANVACTDHRRLRSVRPPLLHWACPDPALPLAPRVQEQPDRPDPSAKNPSARSAIQQLTVHPSVADAARRSPSAAQPPPVVAARCLPTLSTLAAVRWSLPSLWGRRWSILLRCSSSTPNFSVPSAHSVLQRYTKFQCTLRYYSVL